MKHRTEALRRNTVKRSNTLWGYLFIAPTILGIFVLFLGPMVYSLVISFTRWDIIQPAEWIGFGNYIRMFGDKVVLHSLGVTLYYTALSVPGIVVTMFLLALLLNTKTKGISVFRTIFYVPAIVPAVAYSVLWMFIYQPQFGLINNLLGIIGIPPQDWIYGEKSVIPALALASIWGAGNTMIVYLVGLQGIPAELYESMEMDGGGAMHKLWFITVPMMSPVIFYNMTITIITSMQTFTQSFIMTGGGPNNASLFYVLHMYRVAFHNQQMGYASAMSWLLFVLVGVITVIVFRLSDTWVFYESGGSDEK